MAIQYKSCKVILFVLKIALTDADLMDATSDWKQPVRQHIYAKSTIMKHASFCLIMIPCLPHVDDDTAKRPRQPNNTCQISTCARMYFYIPSWDTAAV